MTGGDGSVVLDIDGMTCASCVQKVERALERVARALDAGERRAHDHLDIGLLADGRDEVAHERDAIGGRLVHLPIAGDEFFAGDHRGKYLGCELRAQS